MVCEHLAPLEAALIESGMRETFRGATWSDNCREWVYFDVQLDTEALQARFQLPDCVAVHVNHDPKSGQERGFVCNTCNDAVMGLYESGRLFQ
jgi:hypothetical protein